MIDYKEETKQALFQQDWEEVNLILNRVIKDDSVDSPYNVKLQDMCIRQGFSFGKHFNLIAHE